MLATESVVINSGWLLTIIRVVSRKPPRYLRASHAISNRTNMIRSYGPVSPRLYSSPTVLLSIIASDEYAEDPHRLPASKAECGRYHG